MGLLSLERSLYNLSKKTSPETAAPPGYLVLATRVLAAIRRSVFSTEPFSDLSEELETVRRELHVGCESTDVAESAARVEVALEVYKSRIREANETRANDFRYILDVLNETFSRLHSGSEKSGASLKQLETGLCHAAKIDDLPTVRVHLKQIVEFVRSEGKRDHIQNQETLITLGQQIRQVHTAASRFRHQMPGRSEAVEYLNSQLARTASSQDLHVALFAADSLRAIRSRHGEEVAAQVLDELGRQEIPSIEPRGQVFCWSPNSILLIWQHHDQTIAAADIATRLPSPLEHRVFVGTRVATFSIVLRSIVMQAVGPVEEIVWALDRFWKGGPAC